MAAVALGGVVAIASLLPDWYVPGWAAVLFGLLVVPVIAREQVDGTYHLVAGRNAERWTSKDLKRVLDRDWHVVDGVSFWNGDADHLAVGPGGIVLIETKHTDSVFDLTSRQSRELAEGWIAKAKRRTRTVNALLRPHGAEAKAMILIWGGEVTGTPAIYDDVLVIHRSEMRDQVQTWNDWTPVLSGQDVADIVSDLEAYRARRWEHDRVST